MIDSLQTPEYLAERGLDGVLAVRLKDSKIELEMDRSVWRAIGRHNLAITASFSNTKQDKIWEAEIAVEGKSLDFITSRVEQEWWMTTVPSSAPPWMTPYKNLPTTLRKNLSRRKKSQRISLTRQSRNQVTLKSEVDLCDDGGSCSSTPAGVWLNPIPSAVRRQPANSK